MSSEKDKKKAVQPAGDEEIVVLIPEEEESLESRSIQPEIKEWRTTEEITPYTEVDAGAKGKKPSFKIRGAILVFVCLVIAAFSLFFWKKGSGDAIDSASVKAERAANAEKEAMADLEQIELCLRGYLGAETVSEKVKFSRHPERVKPLMEDHYKHNEMKAFTYKVLAGFLPLVMDGVSFNYLLATDSNNQKKSVLVEALDDGSYRVDWESEVSYLPMAWDDFLENGHDGPLEMRVSAEVGKLYLDEFSDDEKYHCYRLKTRDSPNSVYAYVEQASEAGLKMNKMMQTAKLTGDRKPQSMILSLSLVKKAAARNVVVIDQFITPRWTYVNEK